MATFNDLPEDLVSEIFVLLPVDSLMQLKCVQKSWCSLIAKSTFVARHLHHQINNKNRCALLKSELSRETNILSFLSLDDKTESSAGENHASTMERIVEVPQYEDRLYVPFFGHCHGIVCIGWRNIKVILANPAIREFRELPASFFHDPLRGSDAVNCFPLAIGFGYDRKSKDYKVIRVLSFLGAPEFVPPPIRAEVYTLSTDSWRPICDIEPFGTGIFFLGGYECLYFGGTCYWIAWGRFGEKENFILSFDLSDEIFGKIPVPNSSFNTFKESWSIVSWNESLALVLLDRSAIEYISSEIWVMDEFGVNGSWKKLFTIESNPRLGNPLVFWENDKLIMEDKHGRLCYYNLSTQVIKELPVQHYSRQFAAVIYTSSLVSVRAGNRLDLGEFDLANDIQKLYI